MRFLMTAGALVVCLTSLAGCVKTTVTPFTGVASYGVVSPESVMVYRDPGLIPAPYKELGVVSAHGDFTTFGEADIVKALRVEAGKLGANGLLLAEIKSPRGAGKVAGVLFGGEHALRRGQALAIRIQTDSASRSSPPAHAPPPASVDSAP